MRHDDPRIDNRCPAPLARLACINPPCPIGLLTRFVLLGLTLLALPLRAQEISAYPPVLYSGINVITITAPAGLDNVTGRVGGQWRALTTGLSAPYIRITSGATFVQCGTKVTFVVFIKSTRPIGLFELRVADCDGNIKYFDFRESETWNVYREDFGNVMLGATACHTFTVDARNTSIVIDSVSCPSPLFRIRYTNGRPPLRLRSNGSYEYDVCYTPVKTGRTKMPVLVYIRRDYPTGGQTNFIVADTAYVNVVTTPTAPLQPPPLAARRRKRPPSSELIAQPPMIILPPPEDTVRIIPKVMPSIARAVPIVLDTLQAHPREAGEPAEIVVAETITDPTTHRAILLPTARSVDSGKIFLANYDVVGWLAGYGLTDRVTLLAGLLYVPRFVDFNVVATGGARYELYREGVVRGAAGMQVNYSKSDASTIILLSPYVVASLGDDDRRISAALGYTWRHHTPTTGEPFNRQAVVLGIGGDYRIGTNWKIAAEGYLLQSAEAQPVAATLRYFTEHFAIDAGMGLGIGASGGVQVAPIVTGTWVW
jgi:hypothetical protein